MLRKAVYLCVVLASLFVFGGMHVTQAQDGLPPKAGLMLYQGDGWWFHYPEQAMLNVVSETELSVVGPFVKIRHADYDAVIEGPAYQVDIAVYDNPERVFPEVWAERQILADWQALQAAGGPNPLPVAEDGLSLDLSKVQGIIINGLPAFKVEFFGGDARIWHVYLPANDKIVVFSYRENIIENDPLALMQLDIYTLILNTFEVAAE